MKLLLKVVLLYCTKRCSQTNYRYDMLLVKSFQQHEIEGFFFLWPQIFRIWLSKAFQKLECIRGQIHLLLNICQCCIILNNQTCINSDGTKTYLIKNTSSEIGFEALSTDFFHCTGYFLLNFSSCKYVFLLFSFLLNFVFAHLYSF